MRKQIMCDVAQIARDADERHDVVGRTQAAQTWRDMATDAEARRAPKYLTWYGRADEAQGESLMSYYYGDDLDLGDRMEADQMQAQIDARARKTIKNPGPPRCSCGHVWQDSDPGFCPECKRGF